MHAATPEQLIALQGFILRQIDTADVHLSPLNTIKQARFLPFA